MLYINPLGEEHVAKTFSCSGPSLHCFLSQQTPLNFVKISLSILVFFSKNWNPVLKIVPASMFPCSLFQFQASIKVPDPFELDFEWRYGSSVYPRLSRFLSNIW